MNFSALISPVGKTRGAPALPLSCPSLRIPSESC